MPSPSSINRLPGGFLPLVPVTSASYPGPAASRAGQSSEPTSRRSSSASSSSSNSSSSSSSVVGGGAFKVLKLGPVHCGEHLDGQRGDYHSIEEAASSA
ncbi:hypothetical protein XA68_10041 [Ophiocordyceps unilateralis]|uniref:Uncharacterized protein n=1 Tax=Ophiocordyceps unilateralis TaxID=268505 RepID=A0A2A9PQR3_OPHUN|nr:hypothetical protein XA68_10041 [Ophiocordyceps unilateralis]